MSDFNIFKSQEFTKSIKQLEDLANNLDKKNKKIEQGAKAVLLKGTSKLMMFYGSLVRRPLGYLPDNADTDLITSYKIKGKSLADAHGQPLISKFTTTAKGLTIKGKIDAVRSASVSDPLLISYDRVYRGFNDYHTRLSYNFSPNSKFGSLSVPLEVNLENAFIIQSKKGKEFIKQSNPKKYYGNEQTKMLYAKKYVTKTGRTNIVLPAIVNIKDVYKKGTEFYFKSSHLTKNFGLSILLNELDLEGKSKK